MSKIYGVFRVLKTRREFFGKRKKKLRSVIIGIGAISAAKKELGMQKALIVKILSASSMLLKLIVFFIANS